MKATFDALIEWANRRGLPGAVHDYPDGWGGRNRKLTINGTVSVEFRETPPRVVVEWGDGYRGDFSRGLPAEALTGLVAGFLGIGAEASRG